MIVNNVVQFDNKYTIPKNQPSFGSLGSVFYVGYIDYKGELRSTQPSTVIRKDVNLDRFVDIIKLRFGRFKRVNIMPMCVSDGTEAYAFANAIIRRDGLKNFKKKYRVIASDVLPEAINNYPQKGLLYLYKKERRIFKGLGIKAIEEVKSKPKTKDGRKLYQLSDEYRNLFEFHVEDLQKRIHDLKDEGNSVIIIRNCLRNNFTYDELECVLFPAIAEKMKGGSILITGNYDRKVKEIRKALKEDFVELSHNIWGLKKHGIVRNYFTKFLLFCMKI